MSYYDFDDHFWAPQEVCAPLSQHIEQPKTSINRWLGMVIHHLLGVREKRN